MPMVESERTVSSQNEKLASALLDKTQSGRLRWSSVPTGLGGNCGMSFESGLQMPGQFASVRLRLDSGSGDRDDWVLTVGWPRGPRRADGLSEVSIYSVDVAGIGTLGECVRDSHEEQAVRELDPVLAAVEQL